MEGFHKSYSRCWSRACELQHLRPAADVEVGHAVFASIVVERSAADRGAAEPPVCGLAGRRALVAAQPARATRAERRRAAAHSSPRALCPGPQRQNNTHLPHLDRAEPLQCTMPPFNLIILLLP